MTCLYYSGMVPQENSWLLNERSARPRIWTHSSLTEQSTEWIRANALILLVQPIKIELVILYCSMMSLSAASVAKLVAFIICWYVIVNIPTVWIFYIWFRVIANGYHEDLCKLRRLHITAIEVQPEVNSLVCREFFTCSIHLPDRHYVNRVRPIDQSSTIRHNMTKTNRITRQMPHKLIAI